MSEHGKAAAAWDTRLRPELTRIYGVEEIHTVCFEPDGWPGSGPCVTLGIPECEAMFAFDPGDGVPIVIVDRSSAEGVRAWTRAACRVAAEHRCFLILNCDTAEQAAVAARRAARLLRRHRRVALERMYDPSSRARGNLS
jgi:hypothetical protein